MSWEGKSYIPLVDPAALNRDWSVPRVDGVVPLRPLGVGDILSGTFKAVRFNAPATVGLTFAVVLVTQIVPLALTSALGYRALESFDWFDVVDGSFAVGSVVGLLGLTGLASVVCQVVSQVFISHAVFQAVTARRPSVAETWRASARRVGPCLAFVALTVGGVAVADALIALIAVALVALVGGTSFAAIQAFIVVLVLALVVVALVLFVRLVFAVPAIVVEKLGPIAAAKRSWRLSRGRFWRTAGLLALSSLLISLATGTVSGVGSLVSMPLLILGPEAMIALVIGLAISVLVTLLTTALSVPLMGSAWTLIYVDARIRQEGLDITLAEELWS
ncbi:MAG: glycerophosphoryl diester phosphodiesterase membrane domain-containing protein [Propionibacteriaceae bacterium]|nr:glycerophosphoryl diester phosphodiesterase membrane domain-containing protein [Propionibacteriaceae bacterium]